MEIHHGVLGHDEFVVIGKGRGAEGQRGGEGAVKQSFHGDT